MSRCISTGDVSRTLALTTGRDPSQGSFQAGGRNGVASRRNAERPSAGSPTRDTASKLIPPSGFITQPRVALWHYPGESSLRIHRTNPAKVVEGPLLRKPACGTVTAKRFHNSAQGCALALPWGVVPPVFPDQPCKGCRSAIDQKTSFAHTRKASNHPTE